MQHETSDGKHSGWKSWLWMVACCVPMIAIVVLLILSSR
jgi:bacteriorhodopsin